MKNKLLAASILVFVIAVIFKVGMVLGQGVVIPITSVCKTNGGILMDKDNCPAGSEKFPLGTAPVTGAGNVGFIDEYQGDYYILLKNGEVLKLDFPSATLSKDVNLYIPKDINVDNIVQWKGAVFMLNNGDIWINKGKDSADYLSPGWEKATIQ